MRDIELAVVTLAMNVQFLASLQGSPHSLYLQLSIQSIEACCGRPETEERGSAFHRHQHLSHHTSTGLD